MKNSHLLSHNGRNLTLVWFVKDHFYSTKISPPNTAFSSHLSQKKNLNTVWSPENRWWSHYVYIRMTHVNIFFWGSFPNLEILLRQQLPGLLFSIFNRHGIIKVHRGLPSFSPWSEKARCLILPLDEEGVYHPFHHFNRIPRVNMMRWTRGGHRDLSTSSPKLKLIVSFCLLFMQRLFRNSLCHE